MVMFDAYGSVVFGLSSNDIALKIETHIDVFSILLRLASPNAIAVFVQARNLIEAARFNPRARLALRKAIGAGNRVIRIVSARRAYGGVVRAGLSGRILRVCAAQATSTSARVKASFGIICLLIRTM